MFPRVNMCLNGCVRVSLLQRAHSTLIWIVGLDGLFEGSCLNAGITGGLPHALLMRSELLSSLLWTSALLTHFLSANPYPFKTLSVVLGNESGASHTAWQVLYF